MDDQALVMMHVERGKVRTRQAACGDGRSGGWYPVAGGYDLVAIIQSEGISAGIVPKLQIETVTDTTTLMAFRNYKFTL